MDTVGEFVRAVDGTECRLPRPPSRRSFHSFGRGLESVNSISCDRYVDATDRCKAAGKRMGLADSYATLWRNGGAPPDVFAFLEAHAGESCATALTSS